MVAHTTTEARTADWAVRQYAGLVWRKARQFARQSGGLLGEEDAAAELFAALVAKWPRYDPARAGPTRTGRRPGSWPRSTTRTWRRGIRASGRRTCG